MVTERIHINARRIEDVKESPLDTGEDRTEIVEVGGVNYFLHTYGDETFLETHYDSLREQTLTYLRKLPLRRSVDCTISMERK